MNYEQSVRGSGSFLAVVICFSLLAFIVFMRSFDKKLRSRFVAMVVTLIFAIAAFAIDEYLATFTYPVAWRYVTKLVKIVAEGFIQVQAVLVMDAKASKRRKFAYIMPFVLFSTIYCTSPWHDLVLSFDDANNMVLGSLAPLVYLQGLTYGALMLWICFSKWKNGHRNDAAVIIFMMLMVAIGTICESIGIFYNSTLATAAVAIMIMYMYMYAERYNVDSVTQCFKRRCFYSDGAKYSRHSMAVVSMDLNDLKYINDNFGHKAGDIALQTFAQICKDSISSKFIFYRTGGDEFMMLGIKASQAEAEEVIAEIKAKLESTPYSSSFGIAMFKYGDDFDEIVIKADQAMYKDKKEYRISHTKRGTSRENQVAVQKDNIVIDNISTEKNNDKNSYAWL